MTIELAAVRDPDPTVLSLHQLARAVAAANVPDDIYAAALTCLRDSLGVERSSVLTFDNDEVLRFRAWRGLSADYRQAVDGHSPWLRDTHDPAPVLVPDVLADPDLAALAPTIMAEGIRALAFIPLTIRGVLLGKFMLYYPEIHEFAPSELMVAETIAAYVSFAIDQRQAREQIVLYGNIFRSALEGIGIIDRNGAYLDQNAAHRALLGFPDDELVGQTPAIHLGEEGFRRVLEALTETGAFRGEVEATTRDGRHLTVDLSAFTVRDESGDVRCYVGIKRDVTDRILREAELREALSAKDAFLGMVSHELRTPLTIIAGNAGLLARRNGRIDEDSRHAMIQEISGNASRLSRIIDNMLALARVDQGVIPEVEPTLLARLAEQVVAQHRKLSPDREITVDAQDAEPIACVPQYVSQVIENLVTNAVRYTEGPVEVVIGRSDTFTEVHVLDRGEGVRPELAERIFEPFTRGATGSDHPGLGIGLSVCRRLVEAQGGTMWVRPRDGGGSDFGFALPNGATLAI